MSQIAKQDHEPVEVEDRKSIGRATREVILMSQDGKCGSCGADATVHATETDHRIALQLGGPNSLSNLWVLCIPCHKIKTAADLKAIAKAKRRKAKHDGTFPPAPQKLRGRGFQRRFQP